MLWTVFPHACSTNNHNTYIHISFYYLGSILWSFHLLPIILLFFTRNFQSIYWNKAQASLMAQLSPISASYFDNIRAKFSSTALEVRLYLIRTICHQVASCIKFLGTLYQDGLNYRLPSLIAYPQIRIWWEVQTKNHWTSIF